MLPNLNTWGFPICLSGISHPLALHKEMADHERRRDDMKKMRFQENLQVYNMIGPETREALEHRGERDGGDVTNGTVMKHDFSRIPLVCTAKAA